MIDLEVMHWTTWKPQWSHCQCQHLSGKAGVSKVIVVDHDYFEFKC